MQLQAIRELAGWRSDQTTLRWSLRRSFTDYVAEISDGRIQTDDAAFNSDAEFVFSGKASTVPDTLEYRGAVHCWAHFGVLEFRLAEIIIVLDDKPRVTIAAQPRATERATLATLKSATQVADHTVNLEPLLTQAGVRLLGDVYEAGAPLDVMHITRTPAGGDSTPA